VNEEILSMKIMYPVFVVLILASAIMAGCTTTDPVGQSTLIIAVKDAPKTTDIGTINNLFLTIGEVSVHRASGNETAAESDDEMEATESDDSGTAGWIVVVDKPQRVDLMQLTDVSEVIGQKDMEAGKYTQIRLKIDSGTITVDGREHNLVVPSGVLRLNRGFVLNQNETLKLTLDFNVEKSIIRTGSDQYKLKPVIAVIS
jgi:predicted small secreted protein